MTRRQQRLTAIGLVICGVALAAGLVLYALRDNVTFFLTPTDLVSADAQPPIPGKPVRLGGLVVYGSVERDGMAMRFVVTDIKYDVTVEYHGIVPDLFREGQGVVVTGIYDSDSVFRATQVLAKHDENYMPPELAKKLEEHGHPAQAPQ